MASNTQIEKWYENYLNHAKESVVKQVEETRRRVIRLQQEQERLTGRIGRLGEFFSMQSIGHSSLIKRKKESIKKEIEQATRDVELTEKRFKESQPYWTPLKEFKKALGNFPLIEKVAIGRLDEKNLKIYTKELKLKRTPIGKYRIVLSYEGNWTIENLTHRVGYCDHWFVKNHNPCMGTWGKEFKRVWHFGLFFQFIEVAVSYLQSRESNNPYMPVDVWLKHFKDRTSPTRVEQESMPTSSEAVWMGAGSVVIDTGNTATSTSTWTTSSYYTVDTPPAANSEINTYANDIEEQRRMEEQRRQLIEEEQRRLGRSMAPPPDFNYQ